MTIDELYHHGILGQKWGKRNGPPYPLGSGDHSSSEKSAGWKASLKKNKPVGNRSGGKSDVAGSELGQAVAVISTSIAALAVTTVATKAVVNHAYKKDIKQNVENSEYKPLTKIKGAHSEKQDLAKINPDYDTENADFGNYMNCVLCSTAYEMRRRGYDVEANTTTFGRKPEEVAKYFGVDKKEIKSSKKYAEFEKELLSQPNGARGIMFTGVGDFDSKHAMVWENKNGKITVLDGQSNKIYTTLDSSIVNKKSSNKYQYIRTDNIPDESINTTYIRDAIRPAR